MSRQTQACSTAPTARRATTTAWRARSRTSSTGVRSGDLGMLPVIVGLVLIWTVFSALNPIFLSPNNLVNLLFDCATVGVISLGIVCVLMLGEIDLSVGSMSGLASAMIGVLWVNAGRVRCRWPSLAALAAGALIGAIYAILLNRLGDAELRLDPLGPARAPRAAALHARPHRLDQPALRLAARRLRPALDHAGLAVLPASALLPGVVMVWVGLSRHAPAHGGEPVGAARLDGLVAQGRRADRRRWQVAIYYLNLGRGVPWMFGLFVLLVVILNYACTRTKWGRSMFAVGGNARGGAARRASTSAGSTSPPSCSARRSPRWAASCRPRASPRPASRPGTGDVNLNAIAAAVIGGTSLFGGRGSAWSALLGIIVIQSISNGLTLLNLSSSLRYMITGGVLAIAVIVDSLARQSRVCHGRA